MVKEQESLIPQKSVFNRITGDSHFELEFAAFLENCLDVVSYAKNYPGMPFKLDYINADGDISNYYPDFLVKLTDGRMIVAETKGREDLDVPLKMHRLSQWCEDVNRASTDVTYDFVYVDQESFDVYRPETFQQLLDGFSEYKSAL
jgi:type III restriction enzyme